jgi:hypothetical protein
MLSILRRFLFVAGALLLAGGWGATGFISQHQQAAGDDALTWWVEGVELSDDVGYVPGLAARGGGGNSPTLEQVFQMLESDGDTASSGDAATRPPQAGTSRVLWPSMWLHVLAVAAMAVGAGLMAMVVPWQGDDDGGAEDESSSQMPLRLQRGP